MKRPFQSLFVRIFAAVFGASALLAGVLIFGTSAVLRAIAYDGTSTLRRNLETYLDYIVRDFEQDPRPERWVELSGRLPLYVRIYDVKGTVWTSPEGGADFDRVDDYVAEARGGSGLPAYSMMRRLPFLRQSATRTYAFLPQHSDLAVRTWPLGVIVLVLLGIPCVGYGLIRRELAPIHDLHRAAKSIAQGDLNPPLSSRGAVELRDLAQAFRVMSASVQSSIEARERLLHDVSHELRTPLARIGFHVEGVKDAALREEIRVDLAEIDALTKALLERESFERQLVQGSLKAVDVKEVLHRLVAGRPGVRLEWHATADRHALGTEAALTTVFRNLLDNAEKYSLSGNASVTVVGEGREDGVMVRVIDSGVGMTEKDLARLGEPFFRAEAQQGSVRGFGLGINLTRRILDALGGELRYESRVGAGTTATVRLRRAPVAVRQVAS